VALRQSLIELSNSRFVQQGQETKMEQVYQYLTGMKFRQRVEAVIEKFDDMRADLERERRFMGKQWSKREAQILAAVDSTVGMVGDLQRIAGKAMPEIPSLDMPLLEAEPTVSKTCWARFGVTALTVFYRLCGTTHTSRCAPGEIHGATWRPAPSIPVQVFYYALRV
jgi:Uncharacterized protein conserved in bacteria (DUF2130)